MSFSYSPKTVSEGLVLYLDAGNPKSYPGSGTAWNDLSTGKNHATMYGTVPYSFDVTQCFDFATATGTGAGDSSLGFYFTGGNMVPVSDNFTFECWVKNPPASVGQCGMFSNAGGGDGYRFGIGQNGIYYLVGPTYTETVIGYTTSYDNSKWHHIVLTWDRFSTYWFSLFKDGVYENASEVPHAQSASQNGSPGIVRSSCCGIYTGKLAVFKVYNKLLSPAEIRQNYNAVKRRFGLS